MVLIVISEANKSMSKPPGSRGRMLEELAQDSDDLLSALSSLIYRRRRAYSDSDDAFDELTAANYSSKRVREEMRLYF